MRFFAGINFKMYEDFAVYSFYYMFVLSPIFFCEIAYRSAENYKNHIGLTFKKFHTGGSEAILI